MALEDIIPERIGAIVFLRVDARREAVAAVSSPPKVLVGAGDIEDDLRTAVHTVMHRHLGGPQLDLELKAPERVGAGQAVEYPDLARFYQDDLFATRGTTVRCAITIESRMLLEGGF